MVVLLLALLITIGSSADEAPFMTADPPFWAIVEASESFQHYLDATDLDPLIIETTDNRQILISYSKRYRVNEYPGAYQKPIPADQIVPIPMQINASGYAPDFFMVGGHFVSRKFREVAQLTEDEVQYIDVICDPCTPEAKAQDFKLLWVLGREDIYDPDKSYLWGPEPRSVQWRMDNPQRYIFRDGIRTKASIFYDRLSPHLYVTGELAQRLQDGGIDVSFLDYTTIIDGKAREKKRAAP